MKTIEKIVDELTADNLEERKALLKNHILLMKYGMEHHELKEEEIIPAGYFFANTFPDKIKVIRIGNYLQITKLEVWQIPRIYDKWISKIEDFPTEDIFFQEEDSSMYITFNKAYNIARKL